MTRFIFWPWFKGLIKLQTNSYYFLLSISKKKVAHSQKLKPDLEVELYFWPSVKRGNCYAPQARIWLSRKIYRLNNKKAFMGQYGLYSTVVTQNKGIVLYVVQNNQNGHKKLNAKCKILKKTINSPIDFQKILHLALPTR